MVGAAMLVALCPAGGAAQTSTAPVWAKPDLFWYRRSTPDGNLWLKVDAQYGVKEPLFDHQRLAIELTIRTGTEYTPLTLPFADPSMQFVVKYDGSNAYIQHGAMAIEFILSGQRWRCDLQIKWDWNRVPPTDYECLARGPATASLAPADVAMRRSPDGRWVAFIHNHNVAIRPTSGDTTRTTTLSTDGTAADAWHAGSLHWSADSKSLSAYRVNSSAWNSASINATVKQFINRREWTVTAR
jgi:hypothetical protein